MRTFCCPCRCLVCSRLTAGCWIVRGKEGANQSLVVLDVSGFPPSTKASFRTTVNRPNSTEASGAGRSAALARSADGPETGRYAPGRGIVKFRDAVSTTGRLAALSTASQTAALARARRTRTSNRESRCRRDARAVARTLRARPDVEYAQPGLPNAYAVQAE